MLGENGTTPNDVFRTGVKAFDVCNKRNLSSSEMFTALATSVMNFPISLSATIGNGFVLFVMMRRRERFTSAELLLSSLLFTDFLVGILILPMLIVLRVHEVLGEHKCSLSLAYFIASYLFAGCSAFSLVMMSIERLLAFILPMQHRSSNWKSMWKVCVAVSWMFIGVLMGLWVKEVYSYKIFNKIVLVVTACLISAIITSNVILYIKIKLRNRAIAQMNAGDIQAALSQRERKVAITTIRIVICFILCYLPRAVSTIVTAIYGQDAEVVYHMKRWSANCVFCSSALNFLIYSCCSSEVQSSIIMTINNIKQTITY